MLDDESKSESPRPEVKLEPKLEPKPEPDSLIISAVPVSPEFAEALATLPNTNLPSSAFSNIGTTPLQEALKTSEKRFHVETHSFVLNV